MNLQIASYHQIRPKVSDEEQFVPQTIKHRYRIPRLRPPSSGQGLRFVQPFPISGPIVLTFSEKATNAGAATPSAPPQATNLTNQNYYPHVGDAMGFPPSSSYSAPETPTWGYPAQNPAMERNTNFSPPVLPSIASFSRTPSTSSLVAGTEQWSPEQDSESLPYRGWTTETAYQQSMDAYHSPIDPALRGSTSDGRDGSSWNHGSERYTHDVNPSVDNAYPSAGYAQHQVPPPPSQYYASNTVPTPAPVQPLQAFGLKVELLILLSVGVRNEVILAFFRYLPSETAFDEHRSYLAFRPPAPEAGATCVHNDVSPVLAQTFTEPFVVYSVKRFPGVPDTTALSIAFGNQGQKLPLVGQCYIYSEISMLIISHCPAQSAWVG
ncbi:hypothetical protein H0H93_000001 [Arthromyces matolae]|nr:hypothetical protein H0H93_000001 [Arthromyces matolae]